MSLQWNAPQINGIYVDDARSAIKPDVMASIEMQAELINRDSEMR